MQAVQLFLAINKPGLNNEWNAKITAALKALPSTEQVMVIENNESSDVQISISYRVQELLFNRIENVIVESGATITSINIHFPSGITGVTDPYGGSAISIPIEENMKKIEGVLSGAISEKGILKVVLDTTPTDKQVVINTILEIYSLIRSGKTIL